MSAIPAHAAELIALDVQREAGVIHVRSDILFAAPRNQVFAALADYDRFAELSTRFTESRFIEPAADGTPRIYTRVEGCVLFFCQTIERYARLTTAPPTRIEAEVEADKSDVEYGHEEWSLEAVAGGTRVVYRHDFKPDFWVPPVVGIWVIRRALERDALKAANRIEQLARQEDAS